MPASGPRPVETAGGPESSSTAHGSAQFVDGDELRVLNTLDNHLGNSIATVQLNGLGGIGVQQGDSYFPPVPRVYRSRGVDDGEAVPGGQSGAGVDQGHEPFRQGDRYAGGHKLALSRQQDNVFPGTKVSTGVARVRV